MAWQPGDPPPTAPTIPDYGTWVSGLDGGSIHSSEDLPGLYQQEVQRLNDAAAADQSAYSAWQASQPFTPNMGDPVWDALQTKAVNGVAFTDAERNFLLQYGQGGSTDEQIFANAANQKAYLFAEANVDRSDDGFLGIKEIPSETPFVAAAIAAAVLGAPEALPEVAGEGATVSAETVFASQAADDAAFGAGITGETAATTATAAATAETAGTTAETTTAASTGTTSAGTSTATAVDSGTITTTADAGGWIGGDVGVGGVVGPSGTIAPALPATLGSIATRLAMNLAIGLGYRALFGASDDRPSDSFNALDRGVLVNAMSNEEPIPVIYGSRRVGGPRFVVGVTGASNEYLNLIIIWSEGPIQAINTVYFDGVASTDARFSGLFTRSDHLGADTQVADTGLIAEIGDPAKWNANCTLSGIAYSWFRLKRDAAFVSGLPTITADVDGRTLYDPRTGLSAFSHNPILACRDYLTNARYGKGLDSSVIDDTEVQASANTCDESVSIPGGGTQARYTCDGVVDVDQKLIDNFRDLLSSCRGFPVYSGGLYKLKIDKAETPLTFVLNEDNLVGSWSYQLGSSQRRFNRVTARFFDPAQSWQPNTAMYDSATHRAADNGRLLEGKLELPFTANYYTACQIAQIEEKRSRFGISIGCTATIAAEQLEVGNVLPVAHSSPGWPAVGDPVAGKLFRVADIELGANDEVKLSIQQYDASVYTLDALTAPPTAANTSLPDPGSVRAPGITSIAESLYQTTGSAGVKSKATVSWTIADIYVQQGGQFQIEYQLSGASAWTVGATAISGAATQADVLDLAPGAYNFRVRAFNSLGAQAVSATYSQVLFGITTAPASVTNFLVQNYSGKAKFTWDKPSSIDVLLGGRVIVRYSPKTDGSATWDYGSTVNPDGYPGDTSIGEGPLMTGTYLAKLLTSSGVYSDVAASYIVTEALLTSLTTIATVTESPSFSGTKGIRSPKPPDVRANPPVVVDGVLKLDSIFKIDDMQANIDDWGNIDTLGGTNFIFGVNAVGGISNWGPYYLFANKLDLGSKTPCRLFASIDSLAFDSDDLWDNRTDNIDDWTSPVDGADINDIDVQLYVRTTDDDPNGASPTWSAYERLGQVADYNFRGFDFKLMWDRIAAFNSTHNRQVSALSVTAKH